MYTLQDFGSFYIGGSTTTISGQAIQKIARNDHSIVEVDPNGGYSNGAMYVQFYKPYGSNGNYLLIHGGGLSGTIWENNQFGDESWVKKLLSLKKTVYIIDAVGTGRSGYCPLDPRLAMQQPELRSMERTWTHFRFGNLDGYNVQKTYPNSQSSFDKFQTLIKQNIPRWNNYAEPSIHAIRKLFKMLPNWHIFAHSHGADIAMRLVGEPQVQTLLLIEPAAFPSLPESIYIAGKTIGFLYGDYIDKEHSPFWTELLEKAQKYMSELKSRGIVTKELYLPEVGIRGNTHVPMCDANSNEVFAKAISLMAYEKSSQIKAKL